MPAAPRLQKHLARWFGGISARAGHRRLSMYCTAIVYCISTASPLTRKKHGWQGCLPSQNRSCFAISILSFQPQPRHSLWGTAAPQRATTNTMALLSDSPSKHYNVQNTTNGNNRKYSRHPKHLHNTPKKKKNSRKETTPNSIRAHKQKVSPVTNRAT